MSRARVDLEVLINPTVAVSVLPCEEVLDSSDLDEVDEQEENESVGGDVGSTVGGGEGSILGPGFDEEGEREEDPGESTVVVEEGGVVGSREAIDVDVEGNAVGGKVGFDWTTTRRR